MALLERDTELSILHTRFAQAQSGTGRFVLVTGEAGIGKTSLVQAFGNQLPNGSKLLIGACDPLSTPSAHAPLRDLQITLGPEIETLLRDRAEPGLLFPQVLDALRRMPGSVILIEDIHWADDGTFDLLRYLSRRIERLPVLLIVTSRTDDTRPHDQLRPFLGELARTPGCERIDLASLSQTAVGSLIGDRDISIETLYRRTRGNPFFVTALLASDAELPASVSDAVLGRWNRLSAGARPVVQVAAALGPSVRAEIISTVIGRDAYSDLEEAIAAGLMCAVTDSVAFRHELTREAIFESISPVRRSELYRTILRIVPERYPDFDPAWLAHYAAGAADRAAIRTFSVRAAERAAALGANREAVMHCQRALDASTDQPAELRLALLEAYAAATTNAGWATENLQVRSELIEHYHAIGDRRGEIEHLRELATSHFNAGNNPAGEVTIQKALDLLQELPENGLHARVYATRAIMFMLDRQNEAAVDWGHRAIRLAERHGDPLTIIRAQNAIGSAHIVSGNPTAGVPLLESGIDAAKQHGYHTLTVNLLCNLGSASGEIYELATAERALLLAIEEGRAADLDGTLSYALSWLALVRLFQGRWSESMRLSAEALETPHGHAISHIMSLTALGRVRARRGDPGVWEALDQALALAKPTGTLQRIAPVAAARAEARWLEGDPAATIDEAMRGYELAVRHGHSWHIGELSYWLRLAGASVAPLSELATPWQSHQAGDYATAASEWAARGCVYESARVLLDSPAVDDVQSALRTFQQLGAAPMAARSIQRLRELGAPSIPRGPRRTTRANAAGLTARELDILRLLATGSTYAEIGRSLYVSSRTVEHHVSSILRKLDARTRHDAVRVAIDRNLISG